jgi:hypothetical protein
MMNNSNSELSHSLRDALVDFYLGQIVPNHPVPGARKLVTPEDLYEYLMIDNQVNSQVDTSRIAMGMASTQQYIHAVYNGMEPGYFGVFDKSAQHNWRQSQCEYAIWAANQMLQDYPENYLEPSLRLGRTRAFDDLINNINQSSVSADAVQLALQGYLSAFEEIGNLRVVSGYIDGLDFHNADYYFIGQQNVAPYQYFWRKAEVRLGESGPGGEDDYLSPTAWSEWQPVSIAKSDAVLHIKPVTVDGRLYVAWIESRVAAVQNADGTSTQHEGYTLNLAYKSFGNSWSLPKSVEFSRLDARGGAENYFIAYVSEADPLDKKITLAYGLFNGDRPEYEAVVFNTRFDLLFHDVVRDASVEGYLGKILNALQHFSPRPNALQHPLGSDQWTHPSLTLISSSRSEERGQFNHALALDVWFCIDRHGRYCLRSQAKMTVEVMIGDESSLTRPAFAAPGTLTLTYFTPDGTQRGQRAFSCVFNGAARTPLLDHVFGENAADIVSGMEVEILLQVDGHPDWNSVNRYRVALNDLPQVRPEVVRTDEGGQFLDLRSLSLNGLEYVRLNTHFCNELVARALISNDALLHWDTQYFEEPPFPGSTETSLMDFHGANGRYFWELFFHLPHAVAHRLHQEYDYVAAEEWLHYIFNPQARVKATYPPSPAYWFVRPLIEEGRGDYEVVGIADPDAICYSQPIHYRKAILTFYVRNLLAYGDLLYRRLTRDSLNEAKLMYIRALSLLGNKPEHRMIGRWEPVSIADASVGSTEVFEAFETTLPTIKLPAPIGDQTPSFNLLDATRFRLPINTHLLDLWDDLEQRLLYLRDNLTIDGKPLLLPMYAPPLDPLDLLRAQNSASGLVQRGVGGMAPIPPYRFRALLPRVQGAVETLSRFGDQVRLFRELKDRAQQEELQQSHVIELSQFAINYKCWVLNRLKLGWRQ